MVAAVHRTNNLFSHAICGNQMGIKEFVHPSMSFYPVDYDDGKPGYRMPEDLSSNKKHWHADFSSISVSMKDGLFTTEERLPNFVQSETKNTC